MLQKNSFKIKLLSVVIPAYKQEKTIVRDVKSIQKALEELGYNYEIIVVVDGIIDNTYKNISALKSNKITVIAYKENQGKGTVVKEGMLRANGDVIGFIDAGMDIHPAGFTMLLNHMEWYNADVIVGSKLHPASKVNYPLYRKILSWGYRLFTTLLFGFKVRDTQVGIKFFKRHVVKDVFPRLLVKRYAFDVEILAVAYARGYKRIYEAPIELNFSLNTSTIMTKQLWITVALMIWDTMAVFYRLKIINYYNKKNISKESAHESSNLITR